MSLVNKINTGYHNNHVVNSQIGLWMHSVFYMLNMPNMPVVMKLTFLLKEMRITSTPQMNIHITEQWWHQTGIHSSFL